MKNKLLVIAFACLATSAALAQEAITGMFRMTHTVGEILGDQAAEALNDVIPADQALQWQAYVPYNYDPSRAPGVFIYLDPNRYGGIPDPLVAVMNQHNLIWIGPKTSDRRQSAEQAVWHAILGLRAVEGEYAIDLNRVYIGSSRDTTVTGFRAYLFANEIRGAVYYRGSAMWSSIGDDQLEQLRRKRHVFITGTNDSAKDQVRRHYEAYADAGIENVKLIFDTKRIEAVPDPRHIDEAIRFLDGG
jgi:hypothetical protein